ncbi:phage tail protein [Vibrio sp. 2-2(8)]|uniref:phage tail protein n=1 Tax=Vibrio sp. 2-2(8) TaxID=2591014 RepID=UPI002017BA37|nr:phage tail protein [Vibrio sp. 2-2(8)]
MSDPNEFVSVQPDNRTLIEESLEYAWARILALAPNPYPNLKNPQLTADEFVVLLAGERGVADWQPTDTIVQQRKTTDKAFPIHSKAGTRAGLKTALDALGFASAVTRGDAAYSIDVEGRLLDQPLTAEMSQRINARITAYKSERDSVTTTISRLHSANKYRALVLHSARIVRVKAAGPIPFTLYQKPERL